MNRKIVEELNHLGIDTQAALERFMNNEALFIKFLKKFLADTTFSFLETAVEESNYEMILETAHTLKGVCGNLGMMNLYYIFEQIVSLLRAKQYDSIEKIYQEAEAKYQEICTFIQQNIE